MVTDYMFYAKAFIHTLYFILIICIRTIKLKVQSQCKPGQLFLKKKNGDIGGMGEGSD